MTLSTLFGVVLSAVGRTSGDAARAPEAPARIDQRGRALSALGGAGLGGGADARGAVGFSNAMALFGARLHRRAVAG